VRNNGSSVQTWSGGACSRFWARGLSQGEGGLAIPPEPRRWRNVTEPKRRFFDPGGVTGNSRGVERQRHPRSCELYERTPKGVPESSLWKAEVSGTSSGCCKQYNARYRGYRCAQPPAIFHDPFGVKKRRFGSVTFRRLRFSEDKRGCLFCLQHSARPAWSAGKMPVLR
jgi:hypothetical protein